MLIKRIFEPHWVILQQFGYVREIMYFIPLHLSFPSPKQKILQYVRRNVAFKIFEAVCTQRSGKVWLVHLVPSLAIWSESVQGSSELPKVRCMSKDWGAASMSCKGEDQWKISALKYSWEKCCKEKETVSRDMTGKGRRDGLQLQQGGPRHWEDVCTSGLAKHEGTPILRWCSKYITVC